MRVEIAPETFNQTLVLRIWISGLPFPLAYRSDLGPGRLAAFQWDLNGRTGTIEVAGQTTDDVSGMFQWDGLDSEGKPVSDSARVTLSRDGQPIASTVLGRWDARALGLGGFTIGDGHHLDPRLRTVYTGDGRIRTQVGAEQRGDTLIVDTSSARFEFDVDGRHQRTIRRAASQPLITHEYADGILVAATRGRRRVAITRTEGKVLFGGSVSLLLDEAGRAVEVRDRVGSTLLRYDADGLLSQIDDPTGVQWTFSYDAGRLTKVDDPIEGAFDLIRHQLERGSKVTRMSKAGRERSRSVERLGGGSRVVTDHCCGQRPTVKTTAGARTVVEKGDGTSIVRLRDGANLAREVTLPSGLTASTSNANRATPAISIDEQGRPTRLDQPGLPSRELRYDDTGAVAGWKAGPLEWAVDRDELGLLKRISGNGFSTSFSHDAAGRLIGQETDGRAVGIEYDTADRVIGVTSPRGHRLGFGFEQGRLAAIDWPSVAGAAATTRNHYDEDGLLTQVELPDGAAIGIEHDHAGRTFRIGWGSGTIERHYDEPSGRLRRVVGPGDTEVGLDQDGPLPTKLTQEGPAAGSIVWSYNDRLLIDSMHIGDRAVGLNHDDDGRLVALGPLQIERDADLGRVTAKQVGALRLEYAYDEHGQPRAQRLMLGSDVLYRVDYQVDDWSRVIAVAEQLGGATRSIDYSYADHRLESARIDGAEWRYTYDANGNIATLESPDGTSEAHYDERDRVTQFGATTFTHTINGSAAASDDGERTRRFDHDVWGRLVAVAEPDGSSVALTHDGLGRTVAITIGDEIRWRLLYEDALRPVAAVGAAGEIEAVYLRSTNELTPDLILKDGKQWLVVADHVGSPRLVVDAETGEIIQEMIFDAFGNLLSDTNPGLHPFGFAGGLMDGATGLVHFRARSYLPELGTWTSPDPLLFRGGDINLYAYANGDPVNRRDPAGTDVELCRRTTNLGSEFLNDAGFEHWWLRTDTVEAGSGPSPHHPGYHTLIDHAGAGDQPGSTCDPVENVDEDCVNSQLEMNKVMPDGSRYGRDLGQWTPYLNTCQDVADDILDACATGGLEPTVVSNDDFAPWYSPFTDSRPPAEGEWQSNADPPLDYTPDPGYTPADYTPSEGGGLWE